MVSAASPSMVWYAGRFHSETRLRHRRGLLTPTDRQDFTPQVANVACSRVRDVGYRGGGFGGAGVGGSGQRRWNRGGCM
eukprot:1177503-Prorocentrum_minimum.AAC.2